MNPFLYNKLINYGIYVFIAIIIYIKVMEIINERKMRKEQISKIGGNKA